MDGPPVWFCQPNSEFYLEVSDCESMEAGQYCTCSSGYVPAWSAGNIAKCQDHFNNDSNLNHASCKNGSKPSNWRAANPSTWGLGELNPKRIWDSDYYNGYNQGWVCEHPGDKNLKYSSDYNCLREGG